jgi:predicted nucleotidyltransferase
MAGTVFAASVARVNCVLALNPKKPLTAAEVTRLSGLASAAARSALDTLVKRGIARSLALNGAVVYEPATGSIAFRIAYQAALADLPWEEALEAAGLGYPVVSAIFVHGSAARGELRRESDIDIVVIGDTTAAALDAAMEPVRLVTGREVDIACYTPEEAMAGTGRAAPLAAILPRAALVFGEWS